MRYRIKIQAAFEALLYVEAGTLTEAVDIAEYAFTTRLEDNSIDPTIETVTSSETDPLPVDKRIITAGGLCG